MTQVLAFSKEGGGAASPPLLPQKSKLDSVMLNLFQHPKQ
jgi:hypothetical protein